MNTRQTPGSIVPLAAVRTAAHIGSAFERVVSELDKATEGRWSFQILGNQVLDNATVVLGRLLARDVSRDAFGVCADPTAATVADRLNAAVLDALQNAAMRMGVVKNGMSRQQAAHEQNGNNTAQAPVATPQAAGESPQRITTKQINFLYALGRERKTSREQMAERCVREYGKKPEHLTKTEASALIERLREENS
jgi:hypothetical protein